MSEKGINSTGLARILARIKANFALKTHSHSAADVIPYGECSTSGSTVAKTVTVSPAITELSTGQIIAVKFSEHHWTGTAPTLNVNSLGAKTIRRYGTTSVGDAQYGRAWESGQTVLLRYDGTYWVLLTPQSLKDGSSSQAGLLTMTQAGYLGNSGVTAGSYGPSADASPAHEGTFSVPYFTVNANGRITAASNKTITLPAGGGSATLGDSGVTAGSYGPSNSGVTLSHGGGFSVPYVTVNAQGLITAASTKTLYLPQAGGGMTVTTLWTNSSLTSSFAAQTITLSSSMGNYKFILIEYKWDTDSVAKRWSVLAQSETLFSYGVSLHVNATSYNRVGNRSATGGSTHTALVFSDATYNTSKSNGYIIPCKVFGLN